MNDKELLELAAKAAGYAIEWREWRTTHVGAFKDVQHIKHEGFWQGGAQWNPLADDGDAFRLAVELNLVYGKMFSRRVADCHGAAGGICAATRLAIVRAAASIGEKMP